MRKPEDDVPLTNGDSFFTSVNDYETHLAESVEAKQVNCLVIILFSVLNIIFPLEIDM